MFKATEIERNKKNKSTYRSANKSLFVQNFRTLSLAVPPATAMGIIKNQKCIIYACAKFLKSTQIIAVEK